MNKEFDWKTYVNNYEDLRGKINKKKKHGIIGLSMVD